MNFTIYTICTESYVPAIVALVNSLRSSGYKGDIRIGSPGRLSIHGQGRGNLHFHDIGQDELWIGNRKARFILDHPSERFVFLDADMIVADAGVFSCLDQCIEYGPTFALESLMAPVDHRRYSWSRRLGRTPAVNLWPMHYYNSGLFAGIMERDKGLLENWDKAIHTILTPPANIYEDNDFPMPDQDILNGILQDQEFNPVGISPPDISSVATPANPFLHIGSFQNGPAIHHCTGKNKPWDLVKMPTRAPNDYDRLWYQHAVISPSSLSVQITLPVSLRWWFEGRVEGRIIRRAKRILQKLSGGG